MSATIDFGALAGPVARALLGEPNAERSTRDELRFGGRGSLSIVVAGKDAGTWYDHEAEKGGGVLDLIRRERGGDKRDALAWLSATFPDAVPALDAEPSKTGRLGEPVAAYRYCDEGGALAFEVLRYAPKDFRQRKPDGRGGWDWSTRGIRPLLYRLPDVLEAATRGETVFIVEGEKDADRLATEQLVATCNAGGAGKWRDDLGAFLRGANVVILPDNDDAGRAHADAVARSLRGVAASVKLLALDGVPRKGDVCDWLDAGGDALQLLDLAKAAPEWAPALTSRFPIVWDGAEDDGAPMRWLVRDVLVEGGLSVLYGAPKSSKSFFAIDFAFHVAHGREWFGHRTREAGVVYIAGEGALGVRQRMKAWRLEREAPPSPRFAFVPSAVNLFDGTDDLDALLVDLRAIAERMGAPIGLIVLDTLARMIGSGDEDRARDMNVLVRNASELQRVTGAHVTLVHHSGKDRDRGMRGSNALLGAVDCAIEVQKFDTGLCEGKVAAIKDGGDVEPFRYVLKQSTVGRDDEGEAILSCVVDPTGASGAQKALSERLSDADRRALDQLRTLARDIGTSAGQAEMSPSVPLQAWRDRIYSAGDGTHDAKKKAVSRAVKRLQDVGIIEISSDQVRLVRDPDLSGQPDNVL
ncbi:MAG: AAA family ATPase [Sphingomonas sp.]|nr:AAA family ATPase [Sphingomonas sp.]